MASALPEQDATLLTALRRGDEATFMRVVEEWSPGMLRLVRGHVATDAVAQEVVQDAWVGVLRGLDRFEGRSELKTWAFQIAANTAKSRGVRGARAVPFSSTTGSAGEPAVDPDRFRGSDDRWPGHWSLPPAPFPEDLLAAAETRDVALVTIASLPAGQRQVIALRDIEGFSAEEACNALDLTETNQRVLLHRARSKVRAALESHFDTVGDR